MKRSVLVLIAENEPDIRLVLEASFEDGGFEVLLASSGDEAIAALDANVDRLRALLTDINLESSSSGWDVARHGRVLNPDLPVVYMTGNDSIGSTGRAEQRFDHQAIRTGAGDNRRVAVAERRQHSWRLGVGDRLRPHRSCQWRGGSRMRSGTVG